jgi:hypothetical protein
MHTQELQVDALSSVLCPKILMSLQEHSHPVIDTVEALII